ncbi:MAG: tRNA pseudouridine(38-40) synthase TruA [Bacteroidota bacterium]|nr:tRNA pseudouridine(38-40) synthase TruA [Bacteroidota bacterium]MDP4194685.1 tRNA pseudouridine(38-40) synthase TruA [Bacteroidota bacterium]
MKNYKLLIQYDGTQYAGWQIQENSVTVQQKITNAVEILLKGKINLIGSGRTDTGVHAFGQVANFRTEKNLDLYKFKHSLNALLPYDISISEINEVPEEFHARFDAKKRSYLYFITKNKSPFFNNYSFLYREKTNIDKLNRLSSVILGENDFTSFSRKKSEVNNRICTIYKAHWKETKGFTIFYIEANRFLHGMVRTVVGTILKTAKLNLNEDYIEDILRQKNRETAGEAIPAKGLFLFKVKY